ncbi:MAG: ribonuclease R [Bacteroidota bacterium]|nr:ribonuclease R [Bacteroidota bacterium]
MAKKKKQKPNVAKIYADNPAALAHKALDAFQRFPNKAMNYKQVGAKMGFSPKQVKAELNDILKVLEKEGKLIQVSRGQFKLKYIEKYATGIVDMTSSGNAYVVSGQTEEDIHVKAGNLMHALHGDEVKVLLYARRKKHRLEGEVVEIIQRKRDTFVGIIEMSKNFAFLVPDSRRMQVDIYIPKDKLKGAQHGDKAIAKMTDWPEKASSPFGEVLEVLGRPGEHEVEIHSILAEYGLPYHFPDEVEIEAKKIASPITDDDRKGRRDMRGVTTFTIDPVDAKDFDDALSYRELENGNLEIGIHIADVSHYVKPGSILDQEAIERGTSVYLVDRVVPMLPEVLSNEVCSLRPNEEKLTFSAIFEIDRQAHVKKRWFGRTMIESDRRFTYEEAQAIIEGGKGDLKEEILTLNDLAIKLREERMSNGAITFDKVEVKFKLDEKFEPVGVFFKESKEANHLIEEFMLLANREVAAFVGRDNKSGESSGKTFVYRVHDDPDPAKLSDLSNFVKQFGYNVNTKGRRSISQSINSMLKEVKGKGEAHMIETLAVRSMAKAKYTTQNIGHYGLAFPYYTHFTSPIRRYPDVLVHRLLQDYLDGKKSPAPGPYEELCEHSSDREKVATDAERTSVKYMQVKYLEKHVGEEFDGVISGVTDWGVFVELKDNMCEGMIRIRDFKDDFYLYDEKNYCIIGETTGRIYRLGDTLRVKVKAADLEKKQIDFQLVYQRG